MKIENAPLKNVSDGTQNDKLLRFVKQIQNYLDQMLETYTGVRYSN